MSITYVRIVDNSRPKAVKIDLGETEPVWFARAAVELDTDNFTLSASESLILEKLRNARGKPIERNPRDYDLVQLVEPSWENDKSIGIDVEIGRKGARRTGTQRVFFPKSKLTEGAAPAWLVKKSEAEAIEKFNQAKVYPNDDFVVKGLRDEE